MLCVVASFMSVKNGGKLGRLADGVGGISEVWRGRVEVDVVWI